MPSSSNQFILLDSVDSTNNYAMGLVQSGLAAHGTSCFARDQFSGKGRLGKGWSAEPGSNIILSIVIQPGLNLSKQFELSAATAVATHKLLTKYIDEVFIKRPNDLYWRDRKAGGILIENVPQGVEWQWAVLGIGINVNQSVFSPELPNPVSLKQITGKDHDVIELAQELVAEVLQQHHALQQHGFHEIHKYYNQHLYKIGETVRLKKANATFETKIVGVNSDGKLNVSDTLDRSFDLDEITWLIAPS